MNDDKVSEVAKKIIKSGPIEGKAFLLSIEELRHLACFVAGFHDAMIKEGKHFVQQPSENIEEMVRIALQAVKMGIVKECK